MCLVGGNNIALCVLMGIYVWFNSEKKEFHARLSWTNTPVQEAKASRKFGVLRSFRYESNRNRLDFQNSEYLKRYRDFTSFSDTQAKETCEKGFKTMKNEISRHRFVKQTIPIWLISTCMQNSKFTRRFSFLNWGVSSRKASMKFLIKPNIF